MVGEFHDLKYNTSVKNNSTELIKYCKKYIDYNLKISVLNL